MFASVSVRVANCTEPPYYSLEHYKLQEDALRVISVSYSSPYARLLVVLVLNLVLILVLIVV